MFSGVRAGVAVAAVAGVVLAGCGSGSDDAKPSKRAAQTTKDVAPGKPAPTVGLASRKDLRPPAPDIRRNLAGQAPGLIFIAPKAVFGVKQAAGAQSGPMIVDRQGRVRWFEPSKGGLDVYDLRTQTYEGKPVLTYWEGRAVGGSGHGVCVVRGQDYKQIARVDFKGPADADIHECRLTDRGTMLMTGYETVPADESSVGGPKDGKVTEGVVKEIDVKTNEVKLEWRSLEDGVPLTDSYEKLGAHHGPGYDYIHINSVDVDKADGNLIVSARHTWAEYKIDRQTGKLIWKLGGKDSDFKMGKGAQTAWQHDAVSVSKNVIRTFDNAKGTAGNTVLYPYSRVTTVRLDPKKKTATLVKALIHPDKVSGGTQGGSQALPGGNTFVGWGSAGVFSEFSRSGKLIFDARVPKGYDTYRAYKDPWVGRPTGKPALSAARSGGAVRVDASWNGATEVQRWQVLAGTKAGDLKPVGAPVAWDGLDTSMRVQTAQPYVAVRALNAKGDPIGESDRIAVRS